MLTVPSNSPLTITQDGVTLTYDKWNSTNVLLQENEGKFSLHMRFQRCRVADGAVMDSPNPGIAFQCSDILNDEVLGPLAANFFQALVAKAISDGVID